MSDEETDNDGENESESGYDALEKANIALTPDEDPRDSENEESDDE